MTKWVYSFGAGHNEGRAEMKNLLGGKGANLAEMASIGLPVPPGFTITTEVCTEFNKNSHRYPAELDGQVREAMARMEQGLGRKFGDPKNPLLVSVRSGARVSMPGMMDTVLNLGLNDVTVDGLAALAKDERFAWDSYRRFIQMYASVVLGVDHHRFEEIIEHTKMETGAIEDTALSAQDWQRVVGSYKEMIAEEKGKPFPLDPHRAALGCDCRGVRLLDEPPRHHLSAAARHSGRVGHRGERPGHGVRQYGHRLRHRRLLHAGPVDRSRTCSTASTW